MAPQADVVRERVADGQRGRLAHHPEVAVGVRVPVVDRRRRALLGHGLDGREGFEGSRGAHHVAGHRLGGADRERPPGAARARPEDRPDRLGLALVAERRRGPMGVDQVDLVRGHAAPLQRHLHRPGRAKAGLDRLDHVPAVGRRPVADDLGVDPRTARLRQLEVLEEERSGALAKDESVAAEVERPRHGLGALAGSRHPHPAHVREPGMADLEQGSLGRAADDRDAVTATDRLGGLAHVVGAGGAGRHHAHVVTDRTGLDGDHPRAAVGERVGDERRAHRPWAAAVQRGVVVDHQRLAARPGAEDHADLGPILIGQLEAGIGQRLLRGRDPEMEARLAAPRRLRVHPVRGGEVADLASQLGFVGGRIELGDRSETRHPVDQVGPDGGDVVADGADDAEAGDGDAAIVVGLAQGAVLLWASQALAVASSSSC